MSSNGKAIIVVDVQKDFCEGGSLPVQGGKEVASRIARWLEWADPSIPVLATRDWHRDPGAHFSEQPDFKDSWPAHCVIGTPGAEFQEPLTAFYFTAIFSKGEFEAAYSGFQGREDFKSRELHESLRAKGIFRLFVCGIATDYCVRATVLDALKLGYEVTLGTSLCAGVAPESTEQAIAEMRQAGAILHG